LLGFEAPCRFEGECFDLVVHGEIPKSNNGTFYRVGPDPQVVPKFENVSSPISRVDRRKSTSMATEQLAHFALKTAMSTSRIDGYAQNDSGENVLLERLCLEGIVTDGRTMRNFVGQMERRQIPISFGITGTCLPSRRMRCRTKWIPIPLRLLTFTTLTVNITKIPFSDATLIAAPAFTAHPKPDPETGELVTWGYEAKGEATPDVAYYLFSKDGKKLEECWFKAPYPGLMHDVGITPNYVIFQIYPCVADIDRIKAGGLHFQYDETLPMYLGLLPKRNPKPEDM